VGEDGFQKRSLRKTCADAYTLKFLEFYKCVVNAKPIRTSATNARQNVEPWPMMMRADAQRFAYLFR
jgi:hypothetical protein